MSALVFGEADPRDYEEPRCSRCGHYRDDHYDGNGTPAHDGAKPFEAPCWHGWDGDEEGCGCYLWTERRRK